MSCTQGGSGMGMGSMGMGMGHHMGMGLSPSRPPLPPRFFPVSWYLLERASLVLQIAFFVWRAKCARPACFLFLNTALFRFLRTQDRG